MVFKYDCDSSGTFAIFQRSHVSLQSDAGRCLWSQTCFFRCRMDPTVGPHNVDGQSVHQRCDAGPWSAKRLKGPTVYPISDPADDELMKHAKFCVIRVGYVEMTFQTQHSAVVHTKDSHTSLGMTTRTSICVFCRKKCVMTECVRNHL